MVRYLGCLRGVRHTTTNTTPPRQRGGAMSDEITRYDMSIEWGSMCGCEIVYVSDGEYVRYDDYAALRAALTTAERERDEARAAIGTLRELVGCRSRNVGDVDMPTHTREIMEALRHRAERAERVVEAVAELAAVDVVNGGEYYDDISVQPVLAAYHRYALDAEAQP